MGAVIYLFFTVALVLVIGWSVYVLPTPGDMSAWQLAGAFIPALLMLLAVMAMFVLLSLPFYAVRRFRRWRKHRKDQAARK